MHQEISLIAFTCFSCAAAGFALAAAAGSAKEYPERTLSAGIWISLLLLAAGAVAGILNLGHPELILGALGNPSSGIFLEMLAAGLFGLTLITYLFFHWRQADEGKLRTTAYLAGALSILFVFALGKNFVMEWRAAWNTWTLPLPFIGWALACAGFSYAILSHFSDESEEEKGIQALLGSLAAMAGTLIYVVRLLLSDNPDALQAAQSCFSGVFAALFWGAILILGGVAPALIALVSKARNLYVNIICLLLTLLGTAAFQFIVFRLGVASWQFFKK